MSRSRRVPKFRHYKPKNLAVVRIDNKDRYLGRYDSPESHEKYHRLIAEWLSGSSSTETAPARPEDNGRGPSIGELIVAYWQFAENYYVKDGKPAGELASMRAALRPLRDLYASTPANEFGPKSLKAVREQMVKEDMCRNVVNHNLSRIKRFFRWAVGEELVHPSELADAAKQCVSASPSGGQRCHATSGDTRVELAAGYQLDIPDIVPAADLDADPRQIWFRPNVPAWFGPLPVELHIDCPEMTVDEGRLAAVFDAVPTIEHTDTGCPICGPGITIVGKYHGQAVELAFKRRPLSPVPYTAGWNSHSKI